jgi:hypothetical protein
MKSKSTSVFIAAITPMAMKMIANRNPIGMKIAGAAIN